jgi:hypothetical protein
MRTPFRFALLAVAGLGIILSLPCAAQDSGPSVLSGTWVLNLAKSKIDKRFPITSQTVVITYSAPTIQIHYTTNGTDLAMALAVDDKEHTFPNPAFKGSETVLKASWKKSALVTQNMSRVGPLGSTITSLILEERWTVSPDGRVLTKKTGSDFDSGHLYVYDKQ